ncbi:MAG: cupin domain-containing protein [Bacteroidales bacterium]
MMKNSNYWISKLNLQKHPEGGYFKEVYRSDEIIPQSAIPHRFDNIRCFSTSIYFLLDYKDFSAFHRIKSEEIWHFYKGSSLSLFIIEKSGNLKIMQLGDNPGKDEHLQIVIPRNTWFAAKVNLNNSYSLVGCTVAPGFDFNDFELAVSDILCQEFSQHEEIIRKLTIK